MPEKAGIELETATLLQPHDLPHFADMPGLPIGCKPHDFVFVAVMWKTQILRHRLIEDTKRMREMHAILDINCRPAPGTPGS